MTRAALAAACFAALLAAAPAARAEEPAKEKKKVAVAELKVNGADPVLASVFVSKLCEEIFRGGKYESICPEDIKALAQFSQQRAIMGECESEECAKMLGEVSKSDYIVTGELSKVDKTIMVNLTFRESASGKKLGSVLEKVPADLDDMLKKVPDIVKKLVK